MGLRRFRLHRLLVAATLLARFSGPAADLKPTPAPTGPAVVLDRIAAVVGDEIILESEVERRYQVGLLAPRPGETAAALRDRVLEERIVELLRERELRKGGSLPPDPKEVEARMADLASRVVAARGVPFDEVLRQAETTRAEVLSWIRRGLELESYVRERIAPTIRTTDAELTAYYEGPFREEARKEGLTTIAPFSEVKEEVRELVRQRKLNEEVERWTQELREKTRVLVYRRPPLRPAGTGPGSPTPAGSTPSSPGS